MASRRRLRRNVLRFARYRRKVLGRVAQGRWPNVAAAAAHYRALLRLGRHPAEVYAWEHRHPPQAFPPPALTVTGWGPAPAPAPAPDEIMAHIRQLAAQLPARVASVMRVGEGVTEALKRACPPSTDPAPAFGAGLGVLLGVPILRDPRYAPGQWRVFDQLGVVLQEGQVSVGA